MIAKNLESVLQAIEKATAEAGRPEASVKLIAVSKTKPVSAVRAAAEAGQMDFGENRVQELVEKQAELPDLHWHMIGTLQRNKVRHIIEFVHLIHSVDSEKLLKEIEKRAAAIGRKVNILLQLNISAEEQKGGFEIAEAADLLQRIADYPHINVLGLMGMAEFTADMDVVRGQFAVLRNAFEAFKIYEGAQVKMQELSMGMSGDFPVAIAEGATMVRIGSMVFGSRY